jgi:hypothetical protein
MPSIINYTTDRQLAYLRAKGLSVSASLEKEAGADLPTHPGDYALRVFSPDGSESLHFPIHSKEAAALSGWYLDNANEGLPAEAIDVARANIDHAMAVFGAKPLPAGEHWKEATILSKGRAAKIDEHTVRWIQDGVVVVNSTPKEASYGDTVRAVQAKWRDMDAADRREAALTLSKEASAFGIPVELPSDIRDYAGDRFGRRLSSALTLRAHLYGDGELADACDELRKEADAGTIAPEVAVRLLYQMDELAGIRPVQYNQIPDPYVSVYGSPESTKAAEVAKIAGVSITADKLVHLANDPRLVGILSDEMLGKMRQEPVGTFKEASAPVQRVIARLLE